MILEIVQTILAIPLLILQFIVYAGVIAIYIGHPITTIIIFLGPFAIPTIYAIYLWVEENIKTAFNFLVIASLVLSANYGTGYLLQMLSAAGRRRRGVDLTWVAFSMYGLIISILLVVTWIIFLHKKQHVLDRKKSYLFHHRVK